MILQTAFFDASAADICDDQKGEAYGLCLAAMSVPCNLETASDPTCEALAETFQALTEKSPPWLTDNVGVICPCQFEIDQLVKRLKDAAIAVEGECTIGQLTINVPVPDSIGIQIIAKGVSDSASLLIGAYAYTDTRPGSGQCEVEAVLGPDERISTALIITSAEQEQCQRAIETVVPQLDIACLDRRDGS